MRFTATYENFLYVKCGLLVQTFGDRRRDGVALARLQSALPRRQLIGDDCRALIWGLAYILLWEGFVATAGAAAAKLAVRSYTRSILSEYTGVGIKLATMPLLYSIAVAVVVAVLALAYASRRLRTTDVA